MTENAAIEIHDSTLEWIEYSSDILIATMLAYVHRSEGEPAIDIGTGWSQKLQVRCLRGRVRNGFNEVPMELLGGRVEVPGEKFDNVVPLPFSRQGRSRIQLDGWNERVVVIEADGIEIVLLGEPTFIEPFRP